MGYCLDGFGIPDVEFGAFKGLSVVLDGFLLDDATGGRVPEPGGFSLGVVVPSDARVK
jgi:hypothetical protein